MKLSLKCQVWIAKAALSCWLCTYSKGKRFIGGNKKSRENSPSNRCRILQCHDMIGQYRTPCGNQSHLSRNGRTMSNIDFRFYSKSHAPKARRLKSPTFWALTASTGACSSPQMTVTTSLSKHNAGDAEVNVETTLPFVLHALQGIFSSFARYWAQSATAKSTVRQPSLAKTNHTICKHHHWFCKKLQVPSWI